MTCPFKEPRRLFSDFEDARNNPELEFSEVLGAYVVSRYDDIISVLDRPEVFSSRPTVPDFPQPVQKIFAGKVPEKGTLLAHDNPDHDRLRKSVASFFVPRRLKRFEPLVRSMAHELIDGFVKEGSVEIKSQFALPLPLRGIVEIAGLDPERWEWIGRCLALFGGITTTDKELSIQERVRDVLDLHEYVAQVIQERRTERRDDLISHIWDQRDAGTIEMTDFEHLSMIPGLLLAGHETTISLLSMGLSHLLHFGLWEKVSQSEEARVAAIEELLRFESAITGMPRTVTKDAQIGTNKVKAGDKLFLAYNSGSRDSTRFDQPAVLDISRRSKTQHLGFGRGIHACLGAPLARLLLRIEFGVLWERLPGLKLETPYEQIQYHQVGSGRSPEAVRVAWTPPTQPVLNQVRLSATSMSSLRPSRAAEIKMVISHVVQVAEAVILITLQQPDGSKVPSWAPGAHIDIKINDYEFRQYSICSDPKSQQNLQIAIQEKNKTGVSHLIHKNIRIGSSAIVRGPRNNFAFKSGSRKTVFVAGGIGITPLLSMSKVAKDLDLDYTIVYLGRRREALAFADEVLNTHGSRSLFWVTEEHEGQRFDIMQYLQNEDREGLRVYCCGPEELIASIETGLRDAPLDTLQLERFETNSATKYEDNQSFKVVFARSGKTVEVPKDQSMLDAINAAGAGVMSTCNQGLCGTCEVKVLGGNPEHRDSVLTPIERASGKIVIPCVSRCKGGGSLFLDLW